MDMASGCWSSFGSAEVKKRGCEGQEHVFSLQGSRGL